MGIADDVLAEPDAVPEDLRCPLCFEVLQDPVEGSCCQNPFCRRCLSQALTRDQRCPLCRKAMRAEDMQVAHRSVRSRLGKLMRRCPRHGCGWTGLQEALRDHECLPAKLEELEGKLAAKERELEAKVAEKERKIAKLESRAGELERKAAEQGALLCKAMGLLTNAGISSPVSDGDAAQAAGSQEAEPTQGSRRRSSRTIHAGIVLNRRSLTHAFYESPEATRKRVLKWCLRAPLGAADFSGPFIKVGVIADNAEPDDFLAAISSNDPWMVLSGPYLALEVDMASGYATFLMGATRQSMAQVFGSVVHADRSVRLAVTTRNLRLQNPDAAGPDVVYEFLP